MVHDRCSTYFVDYAMTKMTQGGVYCIPNAPHQNGDLWVEVTMERRVRVLEPAGAWWRGREFSMEEFRDIMSEDSKQ